MAKRELTWKVLPARDRKRLVLFVLVVGGFLALVYWSAGVYWTLFSAAVLSASLCPFYTPTRYVLSEEEVVVQRPFHTVRRKWSDVRRYVRDERGVLLSPYPRPSRMDAFRGVYLMFGGNEHEVMEFIERKLKDEGRRES